jgi:hypothetical protein
VNRLGSKAQHWLHVVWPLIALTAIALVGEAGRRWA